MDSSGSELHPVQQLAEEFVARQRRGDRPTLDEYTERYPELAEEIREVFPALVMIDQLAPVDADLQQSRATSVLPERMPPRQFGDYRILGEIGRGGMGVVYEAEQESLGRRVALKVLLNEMSASARSVQRFQREARAAARMHHTNIVPVFEVGQEGDTAFYAMQLIQGQGLDVVIDDLKRLRREHSSRSGSKLPVPLSGDAAPSIAASLVSGRFHREDFAAEVAVDPAASGQEPNLAFTETVDQRVGSTASAALPGESEISTAETNRSRFHRSVAQIGMQTADALAYAHARGIIHRDIKPSNLILDAGGVVWVTDFGLAKTDDEGMTHTGDILGTMRYMSPERFRGQCDVRADVYSLGLTLYELLVLKPAFESPDRLRLIELVRQSEPATPRSIDPRIPRDLETIVLKSTDKDPKRRYQSADELFEDLRRFVDDEPVKARRVSLPERLVRWSRRNKGIAASLAAIAVLLITALLGASIAATHFLRMAAANGLLADQREAARVKALAAARREAELAEQYRQQLYRSDMVATMEACRRGEWDVVKQLLSRHMPEPGQEDLRRFEWFVHFRRWKLATEVPQFDVGVRVLTVSALGPERLLVAHDEGLSVFNIVTRRRHDLFRSETWMYAAVSPHDRNMIVSGGADGVLRFHRVDEGSVLAEENFGSVTLYHFSFSPDGKRLATHTAAHSTGDTTLVVWDVESKEVLYRIEGDEIRGPCFSPTKTNILATYGGRSIILWDAARRSRIRELQANGPVYVLRFSPNGDYLVAGCGDRFIRVWRTSDYQLVHEMEAHEQRVTSIAFSPNGQLLASGGHDSNVKLWQFASSGRISMVHESSGHENLIKSVCFLDESRFVSGGDQRVMIWRTKDIPDRDVLRGHTGIVRTVDVSPDGRWIASGGADKQLRIWDLERDIPYALDGHTRTLRDLAFSPDGSLIATGGWDSKLILWDVQQRKRLHVLEHVLPVWSVWFSTRGDIVLGRGRHVGIKEETMAWEAESGELIPIDLVPKQDLAQLSSPDGRYSLIRNERERGVLDNADGKELWRRETNGQWKYVFFPDAMGTLAVHDRNTIRLIDLHTGEKRAPLVGHENIIWDLAVSRDGRILASASEDHTVRVWRAATADEVQGVGW